MRIAARRLHELHLGGTLKVTQSFETGVPFFVWAEVQQWRQVRIPAEVRSFEDLESFVPKAAAVAGLDADKPLPFLVGGRQRLIEFHIVNRIGDDHTTWKCIRRFKSPSSWRTL